MNKVAVSVSKIFYISTVGNLIRSMGPIISCLRLQEITIFFFFEIGDNNVTSSWIDLFNQYEDNFFSLKCGVLNTYTGCFFFTKKNI